MKSKAVIKSVPSKPLLLQFAENYTKNNPFILQDKVTGTKTKKVGRPRIITQEVVGKLELAFAIGCTVEEACVYAGIHKDTYYGFLKDYPEFSDEITALRNCSIMVARMTVVTNIEHDPDLAFKYLERKRAEEFSLRAHVSHRVDASDSGSIDPDTVKRIAEVMGKWGEGVRNFTREQRAKNTISKLAQGDSMSK